MISDTMYRIQTLIVKELQSLLSEPQGRALLVVPVLMQIAIFPFAATLEVKNATLAVLNQDEGAASVELMQRFAASGAFSEFIALRSQEQLTRCIEEQQALLAVQIPADFSRKLGTGESAPLQVILDGRRSNSAQVAFAYLQEMVQDYANERLAAAGGHASSKVVMRTWFNPNLDFYYYVLPNLIAIITTLGALIVTALSVAREREQGTFEQLLVSPLTPEMIMVGKAIPAMMVAFFQATLILIAAVWIYRVPFNGSLLLLYGSMFFYVLALVGVGLLISSICATQQQAFLGSFCFMMPGVLLSGFASPVENMPLWLQKVTWLNPLRHFVEIVKGVFLKDASPEHVLALTWPLVVIGAFTLTAAAVLFRKKTG